MKGNLAQVASIFAVLAVWTAGSYIAGTDVLPTPWTVLDSLAELVGSGHVVEPLAGSLMRTLLGFALAMVLGIAYGIAAARSRRFDEITTAGFNVLLFAPTLVIVFVGLLMLGYSGSWAVILITAVAVFPNVGVYMRDVMRHVDREMVEMARSFHVRGRRRIADVYIPYLTPPLLSSSRICLNSSWKVVLLCEIFGFPGGLGFSIRNSYAAFDIPTLLAWVVLFVLTLVIIEQLIRAIEARWVRWA
jgi:ABC-type nitrate/sulfonate/bicarbonate transport system permease component